ncbi:MAG TPA: asparagine synthase (glutamine-hydrolyzing) [Candidatus Eisenbacteria bacterium]|nr:asparagine synthase (glutamine-hydrolyzing) [Candidatus Eisenbacteria bacterium]
MCGIAGLWAPDLAGPERLELVHAMLARLAYRGPDGVAVSDADGVAIGVARLAIVAPHLPVRVPEDGHGRVRAVVNGEIYNHRALAADLHVRGARIPDGPDTALVPELYRVHGPEFARELDGMFAAAVWDPERTLLVLARDRAGEKPLFFCQGEGRVAFASEPGPLLALPWVARVPDPAALARYLVHGCFAHADTGWRDVHVVPPGHTAQFEAPRRAPHVACWWRAWDAVDPAAAHVRDDARQVALTREVLSDAVNSRVPSDVACGVLLSGGVDSGLIAALLAREGHRVPAFSLKVEGPGYDESEAARATARHLGFEHHVWEFGAAEGAEALERFAAGMDQPLGDPSVLPTWALARHAARHVKVVLTGEGGDELFAGYPTYLGHRWAPIAQALPAPLAAAARAWAHRRPASHHASLPVLIDRFLATRDLPPFERHVAWFGTATPRDALSLLSPALRAGLAPDTATRHLAQAARALAGTPHGGTAADPSLAAYQVLDFEVYLGGGLLTKVDRCTMAHGLESRAPFLRGSLVGWALGLPERARLRGSHGKWVLKEIARGLLPADVVRRRKQGFSPPFSAWARGPWRERVGDALGRARIERAGVLDPGAVEAVLQSHLGGHAERGRTLWAILSLQMWAERWVLGTPAALVPAARMAVPAEESVVRG